MGAHYVSCRRFRRVSLGSETTAIFNPFACASLMLVSMLMLICRSMRASVRGRDDGGHSGGSAGARRRPDAPTFLPHTVTLRRLQVFWADRRLPAALAPQSRQHSPEGRQPLSSWQLWVVGSTFTAFSSRAALRRGHAASSAFLALALPGRGQRTSPPFHARPRGRRQHPLGLDRKRNDAIGNVAVMVGGARVPGNHDRLTGLRSFAAILGGLFFYSSIRILATELARIPVRTCTPRRRGSRPRAHRMMGCSSR